MLFCSRSAPGVLGVCANWRKSHLWQLLLPWFLPTSPALAPCLFCIDLLVQPRSRIAHGAVLWSAISGTQHHLGFLWGEGCGLATWPHCHQGPPAQGSSPSALTAQCLLCSWPGRSQSSRGGALDMLPHHVVPKALQPRNRRLQQWNCWVKRQFHF